MLAAAGLTIRIITVTRCAMYLAQLHAGTSAAEHPLSRLPEASSVPALLKASVATCSSKLTMIGTFNSPPCLNIHPQTMSFENSFENAFENWSYRVCMAFECMVPFLSHLHTVQTDFQGIQSHANLEHYYLGCALLLQQQYCTFHMYAMSSPPPEATMSL